MNEYLERKMRETSCTPVVLFRLAYLHRFSRVADVSQDVEAYIKEGTMPAYVFWYINRIRAREAEDESGDL